jgi:nitroreductase
MDFFEVLKGRRSVRKYKNEKIGRKTLEEITEAGKFGASARAEYPWRFVIIDDTARLKELAAIAGNYGRFIADAAAAIVAVSLDVKYYLEDGSAAAQNIINAAYAKGIGTCWVAGDKKDYCPEVLKFVNAPAGYRLICIISCGIPDEKPVKNKPENSEIMHWDRFL